MSLSLSNGPATTTSYKLECANNHCGVGGQSRTANGEAAPAGPDVMPVVAAGSAADAAADASADRDGADDDAVDIPRLRRRLKAYAQAYFIPQRASRQMDELLASPLAVHLLQLPYGRLHDILVLDAYKPRMHVMYDKFLNGVTADFALVVRRAPPAADPGRLPATQPALWASFESSMAALSRAVPYGPYEVRALETQFGMALSRSLLDRCHRDGVAPVGWQPRHVGRLAEEENGGEARGGVASRAEAGRVAVASGPLVSSSLVETPLMQRFQRLAVKAQVAALRAGTADVVMATGADPEETSTKSSASPQPSTPSECRPQRRRRNPLPYDRTERLANSLARLAQTVERINEMRHGCRVALFAGRRSSDLLYLLLQNLYCAAHLEGYDGTSSLYVVAVLGREGAALGVPEPERWGGAGRLVGTHAHEQVSALAQLLAPYDAEAGRRCGLPHAVAVTPLLAHLLFLAANGGGGGGGPDGGAAATATALPDTFTTAAFLAAARAAAVPAAFRRDVADAHGWVVPEHARCFDLFRIWRLDSGDYVTVAEQVVCAWEGRCAELRRDGHPPLPPPHLMNSNLGSVEEIGAVASADPRVRPTTLAFGTLADGFLPFLEPEPDNEGQQQPLEGDPTAAPQQESATASGRPTISLSSVVMKLVQARPPRPLPPLVGGDSAAAPLSMSLPACAVKLGDGDSGKVQVDPRLQPVAAEAALRVALEMARGSVTSPLDSAAVSAVLAEAYDAVTRGGVLMALPPVP